MAQSNIIKKNNGNSGAEDRFIELFCDVFGAENGQYVYLQYPMVDIYGNHRSIDFALNIPDGRVAIEVDGNTWHQPGIVGEQKYHDDLLKQNSMVYKRKGKTSMNDMTMHEVLTMFDAACEAFARKFTPDLTDEEIQIVQGQTSCKLFEVVAEVTDQDPNTLFQAMKNLLELEGD